MVLYQTVEDRDDPDYIDKNAPFKCSHSQAWLGEGYYFWDTFLENAHWWGKQAYDGREYVISEYSCEFSVDHCFDLHGNMEHLKDFREFIDEMEENGFPAKNTTVARVIEFIRKATEFDTIFEAIRANGHKSKKYTSIKKIYFSASTPQYIDLSPAVQLCLFRKNSLNLSKGEIIYPEKYIED